MSRHAAKSRPPTRHVHRRLRRVLLTTDTVGGVWTYALELCRGLDRAGVAVVLATMGDALSPDQLAEAGRIRNVTIHESVCRLEWMENPWEDVAAAGPWLLHLAHTHQVDLVHLNSYAHAAMAWPCPVLVTAHSCVLSWWRAVKGELAPKSWEAYGRAVGNGLRAADLIVAPTAAHLSETRRLYGPWQRSCVIPNGRDPTAFRAGEKQPIVLSVGRLWDPAKNIDALTTAAESLPWRVALGGRLAHPLTSESPANVVHLGHCGAEILAEYYARASIFASPAFYEPFGLAALEAGLSGCALVLGDIPSLREVWEDAAYFVAPDRPEQLRAALLELIENPAVCADWAVRARKRAETFTAERMTSGYLRAYEELLNPQVVSRRAIAALAST